MIAKNKKGRSFGGCVRYVMNERHEILEAEGVLAEDAASIIRDFAVQRSGRPEIKQPVGHIAVSFSPEDSTKMTDDFMLKLAHEYMEEMGIRDTQYLIVRHHNTDHEHFHIVYNRIDNDLKLISVNNDYKRNIKVCKNLKDKYGLTYGKEKEKVNRQKLTGADKVKYEIHDQIAAILPNCTSYEDFTKRLAQGGITIQYKYRRGTKESEENIQGVSFRKGGYSFKGSQIDRKFSFGNLRKVFDENQKQYNDKLKGFDIRQFLPDETPKITHQNEAKPDAPTVQKPSEKPQSAKRNPVIRGVELTTEQDKTLREGGHIYLENMTKQDGSGKFSAFVFLNDDKNKAVTSKENPDKFVKYGSWEMRLRDKILIEKGFLTRVKIKYWGGGLAHPYLWKPGVVDEKTTGIEVIDSLISDNNYRGSWENPRTSKEQRQKESQEFEQRLRQIGKQNKGPKHRR